MRCELLICPLQCSNKDFFITTSSTIGELPLQIIPAITISRAQVVKCYMYQCIDSCKALSCGLVVILLYQGNDTSVNLIAK